MKRVLSALLAASVTLVAPLPVAAQAQLPPASSAKVDYDKDVKPLLEQNCYSCHGDRVQQSGLRLDRRQPALRGGDYGPVIIPGKSAESKLIRRLVNGDGGMQMPPTGPMSAEDIGTLRAWIDQGAEFRNDVADEAPPRPVDPKLARLLTAVRSGANAEVAKQLAADPALVRATDAAGSTPLHHAAGFGSVATLELLLDAGADINARNRRNSTAIFWAIADEAKVRLLVARGAAVNLKQVEGRSPLHQAASLGNGAAIVKLLLEHDAQPNVAMLNGRTPLMAAAARGDVESMRLLLEAKADVNARDGAGDTALMLAAADGNPVAVKFLLDRGADVRVRTKRSETALGNAATAGAEESVRLLLEHGAEVNIRNIRGYSPLMLAASSDAVPAGAVKLLLAKGADTTFTGDYEETARDLAAKRGHTEVTRLLGGLPTPAASRTLASHSGLSDRSVVAAAERAFPLMEKQSYNFIRTGGCNSCHSQDLTSAAAGFARSRGLKAPREIPQLPQSMMPPAERLMDFGIVAVAGLVWELFDFGMNNVPRNEYTDAAVHVIRAMQTADGSWSSNESRRPPMNSGDQQATALAIYALAHYAPVGSETSATAAIARAARWLERSTPRTTQDRVFQALGLLWANQPERAASSARELFALQRADGGWSQLPGMDSDAYATGEAVFALSAAARISSSETRLRKGIDFLLNTQAPDGTWHVKSRSIWLQPYFESGFPYGQDQFISTAGTAWAAMALAATVPLQSTTQR